MKIIALSFEENRSSPRRSYSLFNIQCGANLHRGIVFQKQIYRTFPYLILVKHPQCSYKIVEMLLITPQNISRHFEVLLKKIPSIIILPIEILAIFSFQELQ